MGGQNADLESYAYQIERDDEGKARGVLWYVSMVGHKGSVEAIWAGLVNSPPQACVLYYEKPDSTSPSNQNTGQGNATEWDEEAETPRQPRSVMLWLADKSKAGGGWSQYKTRLDRACAFQLVLLPDSATTATNTGKNKKKAALGAISKEASSKTAPTEFLLFFPASAVSTHLAATSVREQAYYRRLNRLTNLPLHFSWANWLWHRAADNGEIENLSCGGGVSSYLCRTPDPAVLKQEISEAVKLRELCL